MKAVFEIIPRPYPLRGVWIFVTGCITGAATAIGAMLLHERTEIRDGCVIIRGKGKSEADFAQPDGEGACADSDTEAQQGDGAGEPEAEDGKEDA